MVRMSWIRVIGVLLAIPVYLVAAVVLMGAFSFPLWLAAILSLVVAAPIYLLARFSDWLKNVVESAAGVEAS